MEAWTTSQLTAGERPSTLLGVTKPYTPTTYRRAFVQRVRAARTLASLQPLEMANKLGVPKDTYHRYETRTLLPHHLLEIFCQLTGQDLHWLITGRLQRPGLATGPSEPQAGRKLAYDIIAALRQICRISRMDDLSLTDWTICP